MWQQMLFSKKNKNLIPNSQWADEFHVITQKDAASWKIVRSLVEEIMSHRSKESELILFMQHVDGKLLTGIDGVTGDVLVEGHPFARELPSSVHSGQGREITFTHAYHQPLATEIRIPDHVELITKQKNDLLHILTEAHAGREPVSMEPVNFSATRAAETHWDKIAAAVEAGTSRGGLFRADGSLIKEFTLETENTLERESKKKSAEYGQNTQHGEFGNEATNTRQGVPDRHQHRRDVDWLGGMADDTQRKTTKTGSRAQSTVNFDPHAQRSCSLSGAVDEFAQCVMNTTGKMFRSLMHFGKEHPGNTKTASEELAEFRKREKRRRD